MTLADYIDHPYPRAVKRFPELRQSLLSAFDSCALTSFFDVEYRKGWNSGPQGRGQLAHRVFGECLRTMLALGEEQIPVGEALAILREVLRQADADRVCPTCGTRKIRAGIDLATGKRTCGSGHAFDTQLVNVSMEAARELHWVVVKWAHDNAFDIANLVDVEQRLRAVVRYPDARAGGTVPRTLTGQIDALFVEDVSRAIVVDWKDMWSVPPEHDDGEDDAVSFKGYFQQRFYAWLVFQNYPTVHEVVLREFYVRFSESREARVTRAEEAEIHDELAALAERFDRAWEEQTRLEQRKVTRRTAFTPTPGKWCSYCPRPTGCPIPVFARGEGRITDPARAEQVARQLIVGEEVVKQARAALRAYADVNGPIPMRDAKGKRALGFVRETRTERPSFEQIEKLERELGRPPTTAELQALYKTRTQSKFKAHTPPDVDESRAEDEIREQLERSIAAARERVREMPPAERPDNVVELRRPSGVRPRVAEPDQGP